LDSPKSPKLKGPRPRALPPGSKGVLGDWGLGTIVIALVNTPSGPQKDPSDAAADLETDQKRADYSGVERATNEPPQLRALRITLQLSLVREFRRWLRNEQEYKKILLPVAVFVTTMQCITISLDQKRDFL
jgi:hypothetical protein